VTEDKPEDCRRRKEERKKKRCLKIRVVAAARAVSAFTGHISSCNASHRLLPLYSVALVI